MDKKKKILNFELSSQNIQIKSVLANDFVQIECWAISNIYPNRNDSHFTLEGMIDAIPTVYNKPALGAFNVNKNDFGSHDSVLAYDTEFEQEYFDYTNGRCEIPLGVIRESDLVEVVKREEDGLDWLHFTCVLWVKYGYRQIKRLLKDKDKKISVEIEVLEEHDDEDGIEIIDKFIFDGFTILGSDIKEAIPGAHLTITDKTMQAIYQKQEKTLSFAYKGLDEKFSDSASAQIENKNISSEINPISNGEEVVPIPAEVKNEDTEEIEMEKFSEERGVNVNVELTYQQKRDLLSVALERHLKNLDMWGYIDDISDADVYYTIEQETFKAPYTISEEDELVATIDFANGTRVVRSWEEYAEKEEPAEEGKKEECSADNGPETCEAKETCAEEDKGDGKKEECAVETCAKETCDCDEDHDDDDDHDDEHDDDSDGKKETECEQFTEIDGKEVSVTRVNGDGVDTAKVNEDTHIISEGVNTRVRRDDGRIQGEDGPAEHIAHTLNENGICFSVKDKKGEVKELTFATVDELIDSYEEILGSLYGAESKLYDVEAKLQEKIRDELYAYAEEYINGEDGLSNESVELIKVNIKTEIGSGYYYNREGLEKALDRAIADALYAQKKAARKDEKKDFSADIVKDNLTVKTNADDDVSTLKNAANKLRNI